MLKVKKIKPMFSAIVTTEERYAEDELKGSLIDPEKMRGTVKEFQRVLAVGHMVRNINVGDLVKINPARYAIYKDKRQNSIVNNLEEYHNQIIGYSIPTVEMDGRECLLVQENDIEYVIEEYEEEDAPSPIIQSDKSLIVS